MSWGNSSAVSTDNLNAGTDDPSLARVDIQNAFNELIAVIDGRGTQNGVASLDTNTLVPSSQLPDTFSSAVGNDITLQADTGRVAMQDIINLNPRTVAQLTALSAVEGDVAYCSDGDAGARCIAVYNGTDWKVVSLGSTIST